MTMISRLTKESRPLLSVLLIAVGLMLLPVFFGRTLARISSDYVFALPLMALVIGPALLASTSFGAEFGDRTLAFLLGQPISRPRIWLEKFAVLLPAVGVLALVFPAAQQNIWPMGSWIPYVRLVSAASVVASLCSAPFWASVARSTFGALVLNLGTQFLAFVGCYTLGEWLGLTIARESGLILGGAAYSIIFLAAGWSRFASAQVLDGAGSGQTTDAAGMAFARIFPGMGLRSRRAGLYLNLIRRELMLQRATVLVAGALLVLVPVLYLIDLTASSPGLLSALQIIRLLPFALCIPGVALLAGPAAFCEEKQLGTHVLSLTQPVSARAQFFVKLGVAAAVVAVVGGLLPGGLFWVYRGSFPERFADTNLDSDTLLWGAMWSLPVVLLSARVATLFGATIHAVLATIGIGVLGFLGCAVMATSVLTPYRLDAPPMDRGSPFWWFASGWTPLGPLPLVAAWGVLLLLGVIFLRATLENFRHPARSRNRTLQIGWCAVLPAVALSLYQGAEILGERSWQTQAGTYRRFEQKMERSIAALRPTLPADWASPIDVTYTLAQLRDTGVLDETDLGRFHSADQQITVRLFARPDQRYPIVIVRFSPAISFAENTYPGYRDVHGMRMNYFGRSRQ
jgi:hypothetical protein